MSSPLKILIAGGGIAGSCAAYWLSRSDLNAFITVLERAPAPRTTGQAIDIRGPAVKIIQQMGIEQTIKANHTTETGLAFVDDNGKRIAQFDATGDASKQSAVSEFEILRGDLAKILIDKTKDVSNITYVFDESIASIQHNDNDNGATVKFTGGRPEERYDAVIAADGQGSKTRSLIFDEDFLKGCYNFLGQYASFFTIPSTPEDTTTGEVYITTEGRNVSMRPQHQASSRGAYLCVTTAGWGIEDPVMEEALQKGNDEVKKVLRAKFQGVGWQTSRVVGGMEAADDFYCCQISQVKLPTWTKGCCALLGDAGYAPSPISGMGTSLALQTAYVLAGELSKVKQPSEIPAALERYEKVIRPLVDIAQNIPKAAPQLANPQSGWAIWALRTALWGAYWTKVYKLFNGPGEFTDKQWKLPEYDWVAV